MAKLPASLVPPTDGDRATDIINADDEAHSRQTRSFATALASRELKLQKPLSLIYVNKLLEGSHKKATRNPNEHFNLVNMYDFTAFGIMGDLTFDDPLNMLDGSEHRPWVVAIFAGFHL
ncbi:hypothetical protein LTR65_009995 [Meristemomyces frigidus]